MLVRLIALFILLGGLVSLLMVSGGVAATPPESIAEVDRPHRSGRRPSRQLLSQVLNIDEPHMKVRGRFSLHNLRPLAGELRLDEVAGDPRRAMRRFLDHFPQYQRILQRVDITDLKVRDLKVEVGLKEINFWAARVGIPGGHWQRVTGHIGEEGWWVRSGPLRLDRIPMHNQRLQILAPVGFKALNAAGDRKQGAFRVTDGFVRSAEAGVLEASGELKSWDGRHKIRADYRFTGERMRLTALPLILERYPIVESIFEFLNHTGTFPLDVVDLDAVSGNGRVRPGRLFADHIKLTAPVRRLTGSADLTWLPEPAVVRVDLTGRDGEALEKRFQARYLLGSGRVEKSTP